MHFFQIACLTLFLILHLALMSISIKQQDVGLVDRQHSSPPPLTELLCKLCKKIQCLIYNQNKEKFEVLCGTEFLDFIQLYHWTFLSLMADEIFGHTQKIFSIGFLSNIFLLVSQYFTLIWPLPGTKKQNKRNCLV